MVMKKRLRASCRLDVHDRRGMAGQSVSANSEHSVSRLSAHQNNQETHTDQPGYISVLCLFFLRLHAHGWAPDPKFTTYSCGVAMDDVVTTIFTAHNGHGQTHWSALRYLQM